MRPARIGWATPWNRHSAIAQSASEVAFELTRRGHEITVLRTEVETWRDLPVREAPGRIRYLSDYSDAALFHDFDVIVGHIGNHYGFHAALLQRLDAISVVGIFHDLCIAHLLRDWVKDDQEELREMARSVYADEPGTDLTLDWDNLSHVVSIHPMIEWVAARTMGAVAHAQHYADRLRRVCPGPTVVVPLAFDTAHLPPPPPAWDKITIGVVGHANANKRIDQLILAASASPVLRDRCRIRIIGEAGSQTRADLSAYAANLGVAPPEFTGWVTDDDLRMRLRDVDVLSCLRYPISEGASASLVLALMSGRPTLVSDHGCYAEVPDDAAFKCAPGLEALDAMLHLERIVRDPASGLAAGARGRAFAVPRHTATAYADALEPLLEACIKARPIFDTRRSLTRTLTEFGLRRTDLAVARAAALTSEIA